MIHVFTTSFLELIFYEPGDVVFFLFFFKRLGLAQRQMGERSGYVMTRGAFSFDYTWNPKALDEMALILIMPLPKPRFFPF